MVCYELKGDAMAEPHPEEVTLNTLHEDLKGGFADLRLRIHPKRFREKCSLSPSISSG